MRGLPQSWELCTVADVTSPVDSLPANGVRDRDIAYIDIGSIDNVANKVDTPKRLKLSEAPSRARQVVQTGDVLFSTVRPYLRNIAAVPSGLDGEVASTGFAVLRAAEGIDPAYLFYKATSRDFVAALTGEQYGVSYPAVKDEQVRAQPFELPPTREQRRIVAKIEELFSELDKAVESLTLARGQLRTYRQALLKAAFEGKLTADWRAANPNKVEPPEVLLARIRAERLRASKSLPSEPIEQPSPAEASTGWAWVSVDMITAENLIGLVRAASEQNDTGEGVSYIKMDRVDMDGRVDVAARVFVEATPAEVERYALRSGDLLFNTRNSLELVGKTGLVSSDPKQPTVFNNNLMRIRTVPAVLPGFLAYQMCAHAFRRRMERIKKATTSVAAVYGKDLWPLPILIPSTAEQAEVVRILDEKLSIVDVALSENETHFARIIALRQSVLKKAFAGQLVPQDPTDEPAAAILARLREEAPAPRARRRKTA